jgi:hypothetical protein
MHLRLYFAQLDFEDFQFPFCGLTFAALVEDFVGEPVKHRLVGPTNKFGRDGFDGVAVPLPPRLESVDGETGFYVKSDVLW